MQEQPPPAQQTPPRHRGPYKQTSQSAKRRIVEAYEAGDDWEVVAKANGVKTSTARGWLDLESLTPKKRGGYIPRLLSPEQVDMIVNWVEFDCQITLQEIKNKLAVEHGFAVSTTTLFRALEEQVLTYKGLHYEPLQMNDESFKEQRRDYVQRLRAVLAQGKIPIWMDETHYNLFTSRTRGRSRRGQRAVTVRGGTQKSKNLHVIGAISATNFMYCTHKRGAFKSHHANDWVRDMLRAARRHFGALHDLVLIADNAPCHSKLYEVVNEEEFESVTLLKLSPYSPMMNPIENLWSAMKAEVKTLLRQRLAAFMGAPPDGQTREEFRMAYLEHIADEVIAGVDVNRLHRYTLRLEYFYGRAVRMDDMEVGA